jgi:hypothetical protein
VEADQHVSQPGWAATGVAAPVADPTDVMGRRVAAKVIDVLIGMVIGSLGLIWLVQSFRSHNVSDATAYCEQVRSLRHACLPVGTTSVWEYDQPSPLFYLPGVVWWFVVAWLEGHFGWTPGKLAMGLRVMRSKTGRVGGFGPSVVRNLLWIVDGFCFGIVGLAIASRSPGHRRLGDNAAATLVVDKAAMGTIPNIPGLTPMPYQGGTSLPPDSPIWDHARGAYIQWDSTHQVWLEWNPHANQWMPIST